MSDDKTHIIERKNVGNTERFISVLSGALLAYDSVKNSKSVTEGLLAAYLLYRGISGKCAVYSFIDRGERNFQAENVNLRASVFINRPRSEVYRLWKDVANLPMFLKHLKKVEVLDEKTSRWTIKTPNDIADIQWTSELVKDIPNEHLGWSSVEGSGIDNAMTVKFNDAGMYGTELQFVISYRAPAGLVGEGIGRLINPLLQKLVNKDIQNMKVNLEADEILYI